MNDENLYIPQSDGYDVEDIETIEFRGYPQHLLLDFEHNAVQYACRDDE